MEYNNSIILDPYLGSGTTLQVVSKFDFKVCLGIEIDKKWVDISLIKIQTQEDFVEEIPKLKKPYRRNE